MMKKTDDLLLDQLKAGELKAFEQLFNQFFKILCLDAYYFLNDEMEAEDLVQSMFIEFWDQKLYLNIKSSLRSYLHVSVRNRCLSKLQRDKVADKRFDSYSASVAQYTEEDQLERKESDKQIQCILDKLPVQRLQAFSLVYLEDKKYKEAAEEMGITINSVKTHLKIAIKDLREKLKKTPEPSSFMMKNKSI